MAKKKSKLDTLYNTNKPDNLVQRSKRNGGDPMGDPGSEHALNDIIESDVRGDSVNRDVSRKGPDERKEAQKARDELNAKKAKKE